MFGWVAPAVGFKWTYGVSRPLFLDTSSCSYTRSWVSPRPPLAYSTWLSTGRLDQTCCSHSGHERCPLRLASSTSRGLERKSHSPHCSLLPSSVPCVSVPANAACMAGSLLIVRSSGHRAYRRRHVSLDRLCLVLCLSRRNVRLSRVQIIRLVFGSGGHCSSVRLNITYKHLQTQTHTDVTQNSLRRWSPWLLFQLPPTTRVHQNRP